MWNQISRIFALPQFETPDQSRRAKLVSRVNSGILAITLVFSIIYFIVSLFLEQKGDRHWVVFHAATLMFIFNVVGLILLKRGKIRLSSHLISAVVWGLLILFAFLTGGVATPAFVVLIPAVLLIGTMLGLQASLVYALLSSLVGIGLIYYQTIFGLPTPMFFISPFMWLITLVPGFGITVWLLNLAIRDVNEALAHALVSEQAYLDNNQRLERRTMQLQTAAEVGRSAAEIRELDTLLPKVTHLISDQFGFYHVGIFLLDEQKEYAVLRASNSKGGQRMLADNHRLRIGKEGMIGYVAKTQKPRIALDVGEDAVYFDNPHLGVTRSEIALPLIAGDELLGVLDVQSDQQAAFSQKDIAALQVLADQVALAIQNAYLFDEMQSLLHDLENRVEKRTSELKERSILLENAYRALQNNQQKLLLSEKMASLGRLTSGIAHEINTPLATVRTSLVELDTLVQEYQTSIADSDISISDHHEIAQDMQTTISLANTSVKRAAGFIRGIKAQTRHQASNANQMQSFDPIPMIEETLLLLGHQLRQANCTVDFTYPDDRIELFGPPSKFSQVITNLLNNAIDASQEGGEINIVFEQNVDHIALMVQDYGIGIPPDNLSKIFDPMFTTKPFGEGTGLGLSIAYDIVTNEYDGTISVDSVQGQTTVFTVKFPRKGR